MYVVIGSGPTFLVQWLFDQVQLILLNTDVTGHLISEDQWNYIRSTGQELKNTLQHAP